MLRGTLSKTMDPTPPSVATARRGYDPSVPGHVAKFASIAASIIGLTALPIIAALPAPLTLCTFRPRFDCLAANLTGRQFLEGDSPATLVWLGTSLVIAPLVSLAAVWAFEHSRSVWGRVLAGPAIVPNLLPLAGAVVFVPFHPLVLVLTLVVFLGLMLPRDRGAGTFAG